MSIVEQLSNSPLNREKEPDEVDLVSIIQGKLMDASISYAQTWTSEEDVVQAIGKNTDMQKFLISRNLVYKLLLTNDSHPIARVALNQQSDLPGYLENFELYVLPTLVKIDAKH